MAKKDKTPPPASQKVRKFLIIFACFLSLITLSAASMYLYFINRIYPNIYVGNINLGGLTKDQAKALLTQTIDQRLSQTLSFSYQNQIFSFNLHSSFNPQSLDNQINEAYSFGHTKFYLPAQIQIPLSPNLSSQISSLEESVNQPSVDAKFQVNGTDIEVTPSQIGQILDEETFKKELGDFLNSNIIPPSILPIKADYPKLNTESATEIKQTLDKIKDTPIQLVYTAGPSDPNNQTFTLDLPTLLNLIDLSESQSTLASSDLLGQKIILQSLSLGSQNLADSKLSLDPTKTSQYLQTIATQINRPVKEPVFVLDQSQTKVTDFQPPQEGKQLDIDSTFALLSQRLSSGDLSSINLPVTTTPTKNTLTNQLGIRQLLGEGVSHFRGSSSDRIFNLELAASRINGALVPPGQIFSFDKTVGDISAANGYHQGYVIESGKTVLDDGGGVCQDPTTLFRAVLNAGLPVVARTAHAYRVYYYEEGFPPGIDATIFQPSVDFQFKNDTQSYILVETHWDNATETLYYDLYGTSDGRVSSVSTPVILSSSPPPPDVHQPDPTKPKGTTTQIDFASGGARVVFSRTVTKDGQTLIHDTYYSNYTPQANVYLDGTQ